MKSQRLFRKTFFAALQWLWENKTVPGGWHDLDWTLLARTLERGDLRWPRRLRPWVSGAAVLDVGCGGNLQGIGHLAQGARSYSGLDPTLDLESSFLKDSRGRWGKRNDAGISPRGLMAASPRLHYVRTNLADFAATAAGGFDTLVMHNVTEHLMDLPADLAHCARLLRAGGSLVFRHPNYYCWHGHHLPPRTLAEIDPADPAQAAVIDWAHVRFDPEKHAWIGRSQNRVKLDELRALLERHFQIERWEETESPIEQGRARLTPEILARYPEFTERDLAVKNVFVAARLKPTH